MARAASRRPPGEDLAAVGDELAEPRRVLVVDEKDAIDTERADLPPYPLILARLAWLLSYGHRADFLSQDYSSANGSENSASDSDDPGSGTAPACTGTRSPPGMPPSSRGRSSACTLSATTSADFRFVPSCAV